MTAYELMIKTNHHLIRGGELSAAQKAAIVPRLLAARSDEQAIPNTFQSNMYPAYFIPPYNNGKKLQTVIPMSPKTHILSANAYELEIIRLLYLFAPEDTVVREIVRGTLERLKVTCFGNGCEKGECFHAALPVLRFLAAAAPGETEWIAKLISFFHAHFDDQKRHSGVMRYFNLCLSELS